MALASVVHSLAFLIITAPYSSPNRNSRSEVIHLKYDPNGNEVWVARYNGPANSYDSANALVVDGFGNVYVTGKSRGNGTGFDFATVKYIQHIEIE